MGVTVSGEGVMLRDNDCIGGVGIRGGIMEPEAICAAGCMGGMGGMCGSAKLGCCWNPIG